MQGYRVTMEDAHDVKINEHENLAVFGIFDGHGGKNCSQYLAEHLPKLVFTKLNKIASLGKCSAKYWEQFLPP